jgi:hypothetical protein
MRKIVVVGDVGATASNRTLEDAFVERLRAAGVDAIPGHAVAFDPTTSDATFVAGVASSGAQGILLVRLLGVDTRTSVTTTMVPGGMAWGRGQWGTSSWQRVPVTQAREYELAAVETKLFDVKSHDLVWAATTHTFNPRGVAQEIPAFATLMIGELTQRGIIAAK